MNREVLEGSVRLVTADEARAYTSALKANQPEAMEAICGALAYAAYAHPGAIPQAFGSVAAGWLGQPFESEAVSGTALPLTDAFWSEFWSVIDGASQGYDAGTITLRSAALATVVSPLYQAAAEEAAALYAGGETAGERPIPPRISLPALAALPAGSLGRELHAMWVDNGYDPEVLDRDAIGLTNLPPRLRYLNTRILQMHDTWHLTMGYTTSPLHEVAISAFQLAQFGHNYSAMFLVVALTITASRSPEGFPVLLQLIAEAWQHGRASPALMNIEWETIWHQPIDRIREEQGLAAFSSELPAALFGGA
ncbi:MAG: Coq4 family protein [Pseudomonadota bacterium]